MTETGHQIRALVIDALDASAGVRGNPLFAGAIARGEDVPFDVLELDSLTRFEVMMQLEEALGIELDDDEVAGAGTLDTLVGHLAQVVEAKGRRDE
ncbi:acyl carrier protein [Palleronia sp. KMU-117]|uniref:acyl carrier protein n=1 Tax=Palleronia sp. KMU-117 TaxID=3434108 RepID=UPI003D738B8B